MYKTIWEIKENIPLTKDVMKMTLTGDTSGISKAGQFINIQLEGLYLRRPMSIADVNGQEVTIIYKVVGKGTEKMQLMTEGQKLDVLAGLGNGFDESLAGDNPLLVGGGLGIAPLYLLAKELKSSSKEVTVILGFNKEEEIFYKDEFEQSGCKVLVTTVDGSYGLKGFVTEAMKDLSYSYFYTCGPEAMLKAVYKQSVTDGQFSFEARMGCGFGACLDCSCKTITGYKRICREGPVLMKEEILWTD